MMLSIGNEFQCSYPVPISTNVTESIVHRTKHPTVALLRIVFLISFTKSVHAVHSADEAAVVGLQWLLSVEVRRA